MHSKNSPQKHQKEYPTIDKHPIKKSIELKEIRQRGFQRKEDIKIGIKTNEDIKFNEFICILPAKITNNAIKNDEFGALNDTNQIVNKNKCMNKNDIKFSYYKDGMFFCSTEKSFRKGCRPNCVIKIKILNDEIIAGVYAIRNIYTNEELILEFDYENENEIFNCICLNADFCLNKKMSK